LRVKAFIAWYRDYFGLSSAFKKTAAGYCLGRSLVEASKSFGVAGLYSTVPRAWPR
jgi:hypothetical protein